MAKWIDWIDLPVWKNESYLALRFMAADDSATTLGTGAGTYNGVMMISQMIIALLIIIVIFFVLMKVVAKKNKNFYADRSVKPLGGVSLGPNKSLQIVEIGHHLYVLGVGNDITLLAQITDVEEAAFIKDHLLGGSQSANSMQLITRFLHRFKQNKQVEEELNVNSFQHVFQEKIKRVSDRKHNVAEWMQEDNDTDRLNDK